MRLVRPLVLALGALGVACAPQPAATPSESRVAYTAAPSPDSARIERVVRGLRPSVEVSGRPVRWSLEERMAHHRVPGVSIAVIEHGRVAWARGFGVRSVTTREPVTPATLFQAASISKPVAATAMLRLVERGTLDLDADVNRYLASWKVPESPHTVTEKVTLRRLASHTAGLTVHGFPGYRATDTVPTVVQVLNGEKPANTRPVRVDTTPGAIWRYAGGGTTVMQQLLTDVTGKPFPALMEELVLGPAGMTRSTYEQPLPAARAPEAAHAHRRDGQPVAGGWHVYPEMAAAGLWTTPTDLAKWALAIADARAGRPGAILSQRTATQMLTEVKGGVGIGPFLEGAGRDFEFGHGGANEGFHSRLFYLPELGIGAAVMTNGNGGPFLIGEIVRALVAEYGLPRGGARTVAAVALDSAAVAGMVGKYHLPIGPGFTAEVQRVGERITFTAPQIGTQDLIPESPSLFAMSSLPWKVEFVRDATGRADAIKVHSGPNVDEGKRVP